MRNYFWHLKWLGVCAAAVGLATETGLGGDDPGTGIYFRGGMGPALAQRTDVLEVFGPVSGVKVKYDPGLRLSVAGGDHFCSYFSAELENGIIHKPTPSLSGSPQPDARLGH